MSTKRLQKTVIEGGRHKGNKWDRRYSHAEERAKEKAYLSEVTEDLENWYDYDMEPMRHVYKGFSDKLSPMTRWLASQVGRPWDDVRSDVSKTFDTRTTAGRHIVNDHLLKSVEETPDIRYGRYKYGFDDFTMAYDRYHFYVDAEGILREKTVIPRKTQSVPKFDTNAICNWLSGRLAGKVGNKIYWFVPADKNKKRGGHAHIWKVEWKFYASYSYRGAGPRFKYLSYDVTYKRDSVGAILYENGKVVEDKRIEVWRYGDPVFRQDRKLTDKEMIFWNSLPAYYQTKILELTPNYPNPPKREYYYY